MDFPYDKSDRMMDSEENMMDGMAAEADMIADDVEGFGMDATPDTRETVDDGADDVLESAEDDGLDPFVDADDNSSFDAFDNLGVTDVDLDLP